MKSYKTISFLAVFISLLAYVPAFSQGHGGGGHGNNDNHWNDVQDGWHLNPDSLVQVTVTGTVIIDSSLTTYPVYFLDEDDDGQVDYHLNFGPYWYSPDSSAAIRPVAGETVTITGGLHDSNMFEIQTIAVYEINGEFWRDPFTPFWNNMGRGFHDGGHFHGSGDCYSFGMMTDSLENVTLSGTALMDTTFVMHHYYLDEDDDGAPDYFMNFGPPWYEPESGAVRPENGEAITVVGGLMEGPVYPVLVVFEINGLVWRDSTGIGSHFGGAWVSRNMSSPRMIHNPFDQQDWMQINPGWHRNWGGQMGWMMAPDSLFCQLLELYPENVPNAGNQNHFAGYQVGVFYPDGQSCMGENGSHGRMRFGSSVQFQLHYNDIQIQGFNLDENSITAQYWDEQSNSWVPVNDAIVDPVDNTVSISTTELSSYVILSANQATGIEEVDGNEVIDGFSLKQNYPNPFSAKGGSASGGNPATTIEFSLNNSAYVTLNIYNVLGELTTSLVDGQMTAGFHKVNFEAGDLPSGTYFYELRVGQASQIMKMNLMK